MAHPPVFIASITIFVPQIFCKALKTFSDAFPKLPNDFARFTLNAIDPKVILAIGESTQRI